MSLSESLTGGTALQFNGVQRHLLEKKANNNNNNTCGPLYSFKIEPICWSVYKFMAYLGSELSDGQTDGQSAMHIVASCNGRAQSKIFSHHSLAVPPGCFHKLLHCIGTFHERSPLDLLFWIS